MATGSVQVTAGTGTYIASNTISEDAVTKNVQRVVLNNSSGTEVTTLPVSLATAPTTPVTGTFWQATQPISGTVTANAGTNLNTSLLATSAKQDTGNNSLSSIDGKITAVNTGAVVISSGTVTTVSTLTNQSQEGGVNISLNAGAVDTGTRRVIQANGAGKTIKSVGGSAASSGDNTLVTAGTNKLKVFAFSLSTTSTTAMTCKFEDGAGGTVLWEVILQAPTSISTGANLAVSPPAWLFNTSAATLLNLNLSSANAVIWSVSYFEEV